MKYSKRGLKLTGDFEGCKLTAYMDQAGIWTIGFGHTHGVHQGMTCTQEQADAWLLEDVQDAVDGVNHLVKVKLAQSQFDAIVDFVYNLGVGNLSKSTLLRLVNKGDFQGAANEFEKWNKAGGIARAGLTRRRLAEKELFLAGV